MFKKILKFTAQVAVITLILIVTVQLAPDLLAQGLEEGGSGLTVAGTDEVSISSDIDKRPLGAVVLSIVNYFIGFLGFLAVIMLIYAGVLWVVSSGNDEQITKAKKIIMYASIGLLVVILSLSIVRFITSSAGGGETCTIDADCGAGFVCGEDNFCEAQPEGGNVCDVDADCAQGFVCQNNVCALPQGFACLTSVDCSPGQYCSDDATCKDGGSETCEVNSDCDAPEQCDGFGFCHNQNGASGAQCSDNTDCATGYVCNLDQNECEIQGAGGQGGITGGENQGLSIDTLNKLDLTLDQLIEALSDLGSDIQTLDDDLQTEIETILTSGDVTAKISGLEDLIDNPGDFAPLSNNAVVILNRAISALENLSLVFEDLDELKTVMPEADRTLEAWNDTESALSDLETDPTSGVFLLQFEDAYSELRDLILTFPVVRSQITAVPGEGNVPFTVTFDGLSSSDPTGGTIADYTWSILQPNGQSDNFSNEPFATYEFTEPNTYTVKLQVSTSNKDDAGYKMAMDGVSTVLIRANPPATRIAFRVNGSETTDFFNVTLEEANTGITFDPSITVPAQGRNIKQYEWFYGDGFSDTRSSDVPVTHSYAEQGEYFVTLRVTDDQDVIDRRVVKIVVKPLAAQIEVDPETGGDVNTEYKFSGIESRSDDGIITAYSWQILDADNQVVATSTNENFTHQFESPGTYDVELTITDTLGAQDKTTEELTVESREPVANFTYEAPSPNQPNLIEFDASNSYDPDQGDEITYSWDFDGDGQFEVTNSSDLLAPHTYRRTGIFEATLQVTDAFGKTHQIKKNVEVESVLASEIEIDKKAVQLGQPVTFSAANSNAVAYLWEFGDGETASTEESSVTHTYQEEGKYEVTLNFFDRDDNSNQVSAFVLVAEGDNPIALAEATVGGRSPELTEDLCGEGKSGYFVSRAENVVLTAENSVNRDGSSRLLSYNWEFSDGTNNTTKQFTKRFNELTPENQCETVTLTVRDDVSGKISNEDVLYFKVINQSPTITDFVIQDEGDRGLVTPTKVNLKIVGAMDPDGQVKKYRWWYYPEGASNERLGLHSTSEPETDMVVTAQGETGLENRFFFVAEVIDNDNGTFNTTERFGEVSYVEATNGPNLSPVAAFTADKTTISVGDSITFVSDSYDPQGDELPNSAFQWDFDGDGAFDDTSSGPQVSRQFNTPGEYEVRLRVTHRGLSSSVTETVFVESTNAYPQASYIYSIEGNTVDFDASNSAVDGDLEDKTLRYEWDFDVQEDADGNGTTDDDVESTEINPSFTYPETKLYRAKLTTKDSLGNEGVAVRDIDLNLSSADRERNTARTIALRAPNQPITLLNVSVSPIQLRPGGTADITAQILNADNSTYTGSVFFELLEGTGSFSPTPIDAIDSKAQTVFTAIDPGANRIRITATDTFYGDIKEEVIINVQ